jgi:hypothetical protein
MVPFGQINAGGGAHKLQAPASNPGKKFFSLGNKVPDELFIMEENKSPDPDRSLVFCLRNCLEIGNT